MDLASWLLGKLQSAADVADHSGPVCDGAKSRGFYSPAGSSPFLIQRYGPAILTPVLITCRFAGTSASWTGLS